MKLEELSAELQEKVLACETAEDALALAKAEGIELSDEVLDQISGGDSPGLHLKEYMQQRPEIVNRIREIMKEKDAIAAREWLDTLGDPVLREYGPAIVFGVSQGRY